jgi:hypothetical protein
MGLLLKQSTAVTVKIGPFVDDSDGKTAETGLTLTQADIRLSKNGGNMAQKNQADAATTDELGYYDCDLDTTDTNTLGRLQIMVHESGALPVYHEYMVVTANYYDSICGSDVLQSDLTQMGGVAQSATDLKDLADTGYDPATHKVQGLVLCDTTTTNTDMVTDVSADVTAIKAVTNTLVLADIADAVLDEVVDANAPANANSLRESVALMAAILAGKSSGGGTTTIKFRDLGDTKDRQTATVDEDGNRTAVTVDGT